MRLRVIAILAAGAALLIAFAGCGGSGGSSSFTSQQASLDTGSVSVKVQWPESGTRTIPPDATLILISVVGTGSSAAVTTITRPQTEVTINDVPVGERYVKVAAFAPSNEIPGAVGFATVTVTKGAIAPASIDLRALTTVEQLVEEGRVKLNDAMFTGLSRAETTTLLEQARDKFAAALAIDSADPRANFGYAVSSLPVEVSKVVDKYPLIFEETASGTALVAGTKGLDQTVTFWKLTESISEEKNPFRTVLTDVATAALPTSRSQAPASDVAALQADVKSILLPAIDDATSHLALAEADAQFSFLAGYTWGSPSAERFMVDKGDLLIFDGLLRATKAILMFGVAYSADYGTFDFNKDPNELDLDKNGILTVGEYMPLSPFMTLVDAIMMTGMPAVIQGACDKITDGLNATLAETGDSFDLIPWHTGDGVDQNALVSLRSAVYAAKQALTSVQAVPLPKSGGSGFVIVRMNLAAWLASPPADVKAMMPQMNVVERRDWPGTPLYYDMEVRPGTFSDKTFGGLFPDGLPDSVFGK